MRGFCLYGKGYCPHCLRLVGGHVPSGGNGYTIRLMFHKFDGKPCRGQGAQVEPIVNPGKHCRGAEATS